MARRRKLVSGIGTNDMPVGWIKESKLHQRIYDTWKSMLLRSQAKYWEKYPTYNGTTVAEEWLSLKSFVHDIQTLDGYSQWAVSDARSMMFDKDTKCPGNKHYSTDTCCFISHADSNRDVHNRHPESIAKANAVSANNRIRPVVAIDCRTQTASCYPSLRDACKDLHLNYRNAWMVVNDAYPSNKSVSGYIIKYEDNQKEQKETPQGLAHLAEKLPARSSTPDGD